MPTTMTTPEEIGGSLSEWRAASGMTIDEVAAQLNQTPLLKKISREYVRRAEKGLVPRETLDLVYLIVVSRLFGHTAEELGPDVASAVTNLRFALVPSGPRGGEPAPAIATDRLPRARRGSGRSPGRYIRTFPGQDGILTDLPAAA